MHAVFSFLFRTRINKHLNTHKRRTHIQLLKIDRRAKLVHIHVVLECSLQVLGEEQKHEIKVLSSKRDTPLEIGREVVNNSEFSVQTND